MYNTAIVGHPSDCLLLAVEPMHPLQHAGITVIVTCQKLRDRSGLQPESMGGPGPLEVNPPMLSG